MKFDRWTVQRRVADLCYSGAEGSLFLLHCKRRLKSDAPLISPKLLSSLHITFKISQDRTKAIDSGDFDINFSGDIV